jgi:NADPH-dependent 2,4-dienoyl-CoA reductase/sulfur reductase-like enzyme
LDLAATSTVETDRGILVDELLQTNLPDVYAAGDCAQHRQPGAGEVPIEQLWYTGRMQGETVAHTICGRPTPYRRGVWFNSAKFFNLEYQTYGQVPARTPDDMESFYWQHPTGNCALRINFAPQGGNVVVGFNAMGLRLRQAVCENWIKAQTPIETVLKELKKANFDPEFYRRHERAIQRQFAEMSLANKQ